MFKLIREQFCLPESKDKVLPSKAEVAQEKKSELGNSKEASFPLIRQEDTLGTVLSFYKAQDELTIQQFINGSGISLKLKMKIGTNMKYDDMPNASPSGMCLQITCRP